MVLFKRDALVCCSFMEIVNSVNGVPIRLTSERWVHIVENHDDLAGKFHEVMEVVAEPELIIEGKEGERLAIRKSQSLALVVVYREISINDGFVITAFQTSKVNDLIKTSKTVWHKQ